jgi:hypothetical protein
MLELTFQKLERIASLQILGILFLLFVVCFFGFEWRKKQLGQQIKLFDARYYLYKPDDAHKLLKDMGDNGRRIYINTQMTLDLLFPFVYGGIIIILFFAYGIPKYLLLIPLIAVAADLLENITTAYLAWSYQEESVSSLAWIAAAFTGTKWLGLSISLVIILAGMFVFVWRQIRTWF